jgi:putative acetyltransferase
MTVGIRPEQPEDAGAVRTVNLAAFPGPAEADLVDALRAAGKATVSLVAVRGGQVVGHIVFSPVSVSPEGGEHVGLGLAPMAVSPGSQRLGVGSLLVEAGLAACRESGAGWVVVLGHPDYYPRFGFRPASGFGVRCEYDAPDEAFMAIELAAGALDAVSGVARYQPEFADV